MMFLKKVFVIYMLALLISPLVKSQQQVLEPSSDYQYIEYLGVIPDYKKKKKNKISIKWLSQLITGRDPQRLYRPISLFVDSMEQLIILDQSYQGIISYSDSELKPWKVKSEIMLSSLVDLCQHPDGRMLLTDSYLNQVFVYDAEERSLTTFSDSILSKPTGIVCDAHRGRIYVAESGAHRITVFDLAGNFIEHIGSRGFGELEFNFPSFLAIDKNGVLYVVDSMNFRVQLISHDGQFIGAFGENGDSTGNFARPKGIAIDSYGHIYVADALFNAVQVFDKSGELLYYFGNKGAGEGEYMMPMGIFISERNKIFVTDYLNSRIHVYQLNNELLEISIFN